MSAELVAAMYKAVQEGRAQLFFFCCCCFLHDLQRTLKIIQYGVESYCLVLTWENEDDLTFQKCHSICIIEITLNEARMKMADS